MAVLKKVTGEPAGQLIELKADPIVIGRLQECQIILDSTGVSRKHAEIRRAGDAFALVDLHSRNITKLNGRKLDPDDAHPILAANDRIKICDVEFVFFLDRPQGPDPAGRRRRRDAGRRRGRRPRARSHTARRLAVQLAGQRRSSPRSSSRRSSRSPGTSPAT